MIDADIKGKLARDGVNAHNRSEDLLTSTVFGLLRYLALQDGIRQFDAAEANLKRLEELWVEIQSLIPSGMAMDIGSPDAIRHTERCRTFRHILKAIPKIDGFGLPDELMELEGIYTSRMDAKECGEISAEITVEREIYAQGDSLQEYRFRFAAQRRTLVRTALISRIESIDGVLENLSKRHPKEPILKIDDPDWERLQRLVAEVNVLRGTAVKTPPRWEELHRHLHFACTNDLHDIFTLDWPPAKSSLLSTMYGPDDPLPVEVGDLGELGNAAPTGPVVTALKWQNIDDSEFERLIYNLVSGASGYTNAQWLMHTYAADRGRDVSATKTLEDPLSGPRTLRVIIQCKHWTARSIGSEQLSKLLNQMKMWEPPKIDELIIATTGRFSADAVVWIEKHNQEREVPVIAMWPDSHLERLLAGRPDLVATFNLR